VPANVFDAVSKVLVDSFCTQQWRLPTRSDCLKAREELAVNLSYAAGCRKKLRRKMKFTTAANAAFRKKSRRKADGK